MATDDLPAADPPFDVAQLDALLEEHGIDAIVVTSPHNVRYLLGGYAYFMYALADSIGLGRYLPAVAYRRGFPEQSLYVGAGNEAWGEGVDELWVASAQLDSWGAEDTAARVATWAAARLGPSATIGVERAYLPADGAQRLERDLGARSLVDVTEVLESLRAVKRPHELDLIRQSSTAVVDAILATFAHARVGETKRQIVQRLREQETVRGLTYCYALIAAGASTHRGPSGQVLADGEVLSLDSGAMFEGWVADLTRMGIAGSVTPRHDELLAQVDAVQQAARRAATQGARGDGIFAAAHAVISDLPDGAAMSFLAHGTGLVTHEAPRLTATGSPPYPAPYADRPLQAGMVLSIESQVVDPVVGFVKLEDTIIVTESAPEAVADHGRGFNPIGTA